MTLKIYEEYLKSSDIGLVRMTSEFKVIEKNIYSERYTSIPKRGANFAGEFFNDEIMKDVEKLPLKCGSFCLIPLDRGEILRQGLLVRINNGELVFVFHTSFSMAKYLEAEYSESVLRVIAKCIVNLYESVGFGLESVLTPNIFPADNSYLAKKHDGIRVIPLSECTALLKQTVSAIKPVKTLKLEMSPNLMDRFKYIDAAILTYTMAEIFATSILYSMRNKILIKADVNGCMVTLKARGEYLIKNSEKPALLSRADVKLTLVAGILASIGISTSAKLEGNEFEISASLPLECIPEDKLRSVNTVIGAKYVQSIFDGISSFIGFAEEKSPIKLELDAY